MAIFQITSLNSVVTNADSEPAFESDTTAADTLIVNAGAFLKALGHDAYGAYLNRTMAWKVQVNGLIHSEHSVGLFVEFGNPQASSVSVGVSGTIYGGNIGCYNPNNLVNAGTIQGVDTAIYADGASAQNIRNSGWLLGASSIFTGNGADTVTNSGSIGGKISLNSGNDRLVNTGAIFDTVLMGDDDDTVTNSKGAMHGELYLGRGNDTLINLAGIGGTIFGGNGNDTILNKGFVGKDIELNDGLNSLTNSGTVYGNVHGGNDKDVVKNAGTIEGVVDLGAGDDFYTGGNRTDIVVDGAGSDIVKLGGGDDFYYALGVFDQANDALDNIDGGAGIDIYNATSATDSVFINFDKVAHDFSPFLPGAGLVAAFTATGIGLSIDTIRNFEAVLGGAGSDIVYGSAAANVLSGNAGFDTLYGFAGNDVLNGGDDGDALCGGAGRDVLTGGAGADFFHFTSITDSAPKAGARDTITDFESGIDLLDLRFIDANTRNGKVDDAFAFIADQVFGKVAGQLRVYAFAGGQIVEGDVNGDGKADFQIELSATTATHTLTAADFLL